MSCKVSWEVTPYTGRLGTVTVTGIIVSVHLKKLTGKPIYSKEFLSFEV